MDMQQRIAKILPFIAKAMLDKNWQISLAESCTGGGLAATLTSLPGSSKWFNCGLVTYSNQAKFELLSVSKDLLKKDGAVSSNCALAMVQGLTHENDFRLAVTGFAGPDGDNVGKIYIAWQAPDDELRVEAFYFQGTRQEIITQVIYQSLRQMLISTFYPYQCDLNCFFAVYLEEQQDRNLCLQYGLDLGLSPIQMEPFNNLHVTLVYLGKQSLSKMDYLKQKADAIKNIGAFDLDLTVCEQWTRAHCLVLRSIEVPKNLQLLLQQLPQASMPHDFVPHVTIAKRQLIQHKEPVPAKIRLRVKSFSLMLSFHGIFYLEYARWNLNTGE